jgi:hypothetical protein
MKGNNLLNFIHSIRYFASMVKYSVADLQDLKNISCRGFKQRRESFSAQKLFINVVNVHKMQAKLKDLKIRLNSMIGIPIVLYGDSMRIG